MPPFRNFLARKPQPNGGESTDGFDENYLSPHDRPGPTPISVRKSQDGQPPEYKLSGRGPRDRDCAHSAPKGRAG